MVTVKTDRIVDDYLHRLDNAAAVLPAERRSELLAEIRAHIDEALRAADVTNEVAVRNVLERLGSPEEIVSAAVDVPAIPVNSTDRPALRNRLAFAALLALAVGPFVMGMVQLPGIILVLVGLILVLSSPAWPARDKRVGLLLLPLIPPTLLLILYVFTALMADPATELEGVPIVLLMSWSLLSVPYLGWRLVYPQV